MSRKLKNTLALVGVLIIMLSLSAAFIFIYQKPGIKKRAKELTQLRSVEYDQKSLRQQLDEKTARAAVLDSILAARRFNIPQSLNSLKFYEFLNGLMPMFTGDCRVNVEYTGIEPERQFFTHNYKLTGYGTYNDVYQLIFAIEESKELKKVRSLNLQTYVSSVDAGEPEFLVSFTFTVLVYYSSDDRFATSATSENNIRAVKKYDIFFPLLRTQIPPNNDGLLDVQGARLLALVPEGAFVTDNKGSSYLLMEGDKVYLGYLTRIDARNNSVHFVLNKGGVIEKVELRLEREAAPDKTFQLGKPN